MIVLLIFSPIVRMASFFEWAFKKNTSANHKQIQDIKVTVSDRNDVNFVKTCVPYNRCDCIFFLFFFFVVLQTRMRFENGKKKA